MRAHLACLPRHSPSSEIPSFTMGPSPALHGAYTCAEASAGWRKRGVCTHVSVPQEKPALIRHGQGQVGLRAAVSGAPGTSAAFLRLRSQPEWGTQGQKRFINNLEHKLRDS